MSRQTTLDKTFTKAVQLHGDLENVICTICHTKYPFTEKLAEEFCEGAPPPCPRCKEIEAIRDLVGKRSVATGFLRPDIVLYNETHPQGELIGTLSEFDLKRRPDLLIVIGTSLKIPGVKRMVREMSRCVHACPTKAKRAGAGKSIFINRDEPPKGWEGVFDYYIAGDSDQAIGLLPIKDADTKTDDNISQTTGAECVEQPEVRIVQNPAKSVMSIASICNPTDTKPKVQPEFEAARAALEDAVSGSDPAGECTSATAASALAGSPAAAAKTRSRAKKEPRPLASLLEPSRRVGLSRSSIKQPKTRKLTATMKVVKNATSSSSKAANAAAAAAATTAAGKRAKKTHSISSS
ncbi:NAD-dependent deacetylase hst3 [Dipsacomyces acuminosporus]|nr:NAD-dependent deacetylase hst3 [Dipsacomyces acuminosporus]